MRKATAILLSFLLMIMQVTPTGLQVAAYAMQQDDNVGAAEAAEITVQGESGQEDPGMATVMAEDAGQADEIQVEGANLEQDAVIEGAIDETAAGDGYAAVEGAEGYGADEALEPIEESEPGYVAEGEVAEDEALEGEATEGEAAVEGADEALADEETQVEADDGQAIIEESGDIEGLEDADATAAPETGALEDAAAAEAGELGKAEIEGAEAESTLSEKLMTADGSTLTVTVTYGADAAIPEDALLSVQEIVENTDSYDGFVDNVNAEIKGAGQKVDSARFFDISIMKGAEKIQPSAPVTVQMQVEGGKALDEAKLLHFEENKKGEVEDIVEVAAETSADEFKFNAEGFSVYGVVYTVDFTYNVGGNSYAYTMEGGTVASITNILRSLAVFGSANEAEFVADIESVEFSNPELACVTKVDEFTTAGAIIDSLGLDPQFSDNLTEEDVAAARSVEISAGDWAFISLKAFDTAETLTVNMASGEAFTIAVTDAQRTSAAQATYKVKLANSNSYVTYWDTFEEAVAKVNSTTSEAIIEVLDNANADNYVIHRTAAFTSTGKLTIIGNGHTLVRGEGVTGDLITKGQSGIVAINNLVIDGGATPADGALVNRTAKGAAFAATTFSNVTLMAGNTSGNAIDFVSDTATRTAAITLNNCAIDMQASTGAAFSAPMASTVTFNNVSIAGATVEASTSLVVLGTTRATFANVAIGGFNGSSANLYAVDASKITTANYMSIEGATSISENYSANAPANLKVNGTNVLYLKSSLEGIVGVTSNQGENKNFAVLYNANVSGYSNLQNDTNADLVAGLSTTTTTIKWVNKNNVFYNETAKTYHRTLADAVRNVKTNNTVIKSLVSEYVVDESVSYSHSRSFTIEPGDGIGTLVLVRGEASGNMIVTSTNVTLNNIVIDGDFQEADGSLLKAIDGTMTLSNVVVQNHRGSAGNFALDTSGAGKLTITGATSIVGNMAANENANLKISAKPGNTVFKNASGEIGITSPNALAGSQFATLASDSDATDLAFVSNDADEDLSAVQGTNGSGKKQATVFWLNVTPRDSSKFYITGTSNVAADITVYYDTLAEAVAAAASFVDAANIYSMVEEYTIDDSITVSTSMAIQPGKTAQGQQLSSLVLKRGEEPGNLIWHTAGAFTLKSVKLDGMNKVVNGSLLRLSGGAGTLNLVDVTACNHKAIPTDAYAVNATDSENAVKVSGKVVLTGNIAGVGADGNDENAIAANLAVVGTNKFTVAGNLSGEMGISNVLHKLPGEAFGVLGDSKYSLGTITNDFSTSTTAKKDGTILYWEGGSSDTGNVVKITDNDGKMLRVGSNGNYAVFSEYNDIVEPINKNNLYRGSTKYEGPINIELLVDYVETTDASSGITITVGRAMTFKTASSTSPDDKYPYRGTGSRGMVRFMNGGTASNNANTRFKFTGSGAKVTFENMVVDGRGDQGIVADQGALVSVGDRGGADYNVELTLGSGAILQNGSSNLDDQGGAVYVGPKCKLYMLPGSIIQYCKSNSGNAASGGAIYLAKAEFYCTGGIIRNCVCSRGGVVDLGGAVDGTQSEKSLIYLAGSPQIIDNYDNDGNPCNVHLDYDSNNIIHVREDLSETARIGIYMDDKTVYANHGHETQPFATVDAGAHPQNLEAFVNDRDQMLTGVQSTSPAHSNLVVWYYRLNVTAVDDYYIDNALIRTTELPGGEGMFVTPTQLPKEYGDAEFAIQAQQQLGYNVYKKSTYDRLTLERHGSAGVVSNGITGLRCVTSGLGKRWEYGVAGANGNTEWNAVSGRDLTVHYARECRDNVRLVKVEDTNTADLLEGASFKLERATSANGTYTLYTKGAGKGRATAGGVSVQDAGRNGVYTTDQDGAFVMNLPEGYYRLTETISPDGYEKLAHPVTFKVSVSMVPDTEEYANVSPYEVGNFANATYEANDYDQWAESAVFGTVNVGDVRQIPTHVLVQERPGVYELRDDMRTTEYVTAPAGTSAFDVANRNAAPDGYTKLHVYAGSQDGEGNFNLDTSTDVSSLSSDSQGIYANGNRDKAIAKGQALYYVLFEHSVMLEEHVLHKEPNPDPNHDWKDDVLTNHDADWRVEDEGSYKVELRWGYGVNNVGWDYAQLQYGQYEHAALLKSDQQTRRHLAYVYVDVVDGDSDSITKIKLNDNVRMMNTVDGPKAYVKGGDGAVAEYTLATNDLYFVYFEDPQNLNVYWVAATSETNSGIVVNALEATVANWYEYPTAKMLHQMDFENYGRVFSTTDPDIAGWVPNTLPKEEGPYEIAYYAVGPDMGTVDTSPDTVDDYTVLSNIVIPYSQAFEAETGMAIRPVENGIEYAAANGGNGPAQQFANSSTSTNVAVYLIYGKPQAHTTITKTVTGAMGNTDETFTFTLDVEGALEGASYKALKGTSEMYIENGGTFTLKHNESIVVDLPQDTKITLAESGADSYAKTWTAASATFDGFDPATTSITGSNSATFTLNSKTASIGINNNRDAIAPTSINLSYTPFLVVALIGVALFALRRRTPSGQI